VVLLQQLKIREFMKNAVVLDRVTKTFGQKTAVRSFDLTIPEGALYGLIGPNGAGKTTVIRMILAILFPDSGELSVFGQSSIESIRHRIGYLPEERGVYRKMRVGEFLAFMARLKGMNDADIRRLIPEWLDKAKLPNVAKKRCEELSKGMQQKIQFITAVIHRPDILILDEPFSGLDPVNQRLLRDLVLEERRRGATILFSTHVMAHAEQLCDHIVMVHQGNKVLDGTPLEIRQNSDSRRILFEPLEPSADVEKLREIPGVRDIKREGASWEITLDENAGLAEAIPALAATVIPAHIQIRRPTLEDVFVSIVTGKEDDSADLRMALRGENGEVEQ
jgi:ABC-2 type transport system ATP-binding protein